MATVLGALSGCGSRSELLGEEGTLATRDAGVSAVDASDDDGPVPPPACAVSRARVFVTSSLYGANFGGLSGADAACLARANAQQLGGRWRAWLGDTNHAAPSRVYAAPGGYVLLDGSIVASSVGALLSGSLAHAIDRTELNAPISDGNTEVWTGTGLTGEGNAGYCGDRSGRDWSSSSHSAPTPLVGHEDATDPSWTAVYLQFCDRTNVRLYCFEVCD